MARRISGVYTITCTANGRQYVGSSAYVRGRWNTHRSALRCHRHRNQALQADWDEHGESAFELRTVAEVHDSAERRAVEQLFLDEAMSTGLAYNVNPDTTSRVGAKCTDDQRLAMSLAHKGKTFGPEQRAAMSAGMKRRYAPVKGTPEIREQMAAIGKGNLGKPKSAEHRRNIGLGKRVLSDDQIREIARRLEAGEYGTHLAAEFGVNQGTVSNIKRGRLRPASDVA